MTDPKLREARIAEATRRAHQEEWKGDRRHHEAAMRHLIDVITEDWRPEPEVDAVTLAFREWVSAVTDPDLDDADVFRAGHAHALANCADVRRMDWLGGQWVEVVDVAGRCFRHGIFVREPGPLRAKIDRAMEGGE